jgi:AcrR family transcriptional regulator
MTGLRTSQKLARNTRILKAAAELFKAGGYDTVKMENIAAKSEVSIGTIYNYYQNKGDLLVAMVSMEVHEILEAGAAIVARPPLNVGDAINTLLGIYIDHSLIYLNKDLWRVAMSISMLQPNSPFGLTYSELDAALMEQTCALIEKLQNIGLVQKHLDATGIGELLFNNLNNMFITYVKSEELKLTTLRYMLRRQNQFVFDVISVKEPSVQTAMSN